MVSKTCELVERAKTIADPRRQCANRKHLLEDILVVGFCGTLAGCKDFVQLATWANINVAFLRTFLALPHGIPSHDTFNRVFAVIPCATLQKVLLPWLLERRGLPADQCIHLDGKTMRRTRCKAAGLGALHVLSAWAGQSGLTLGQVAVDAKSNEITALPQLLELLDLKDKIVTIDAMGCQKEIAKTVIDGQGHYVLSAKDNQPTLKGEIAESFAKAASKPFPTRREHTTVDSGHGREERRTVRVLPAAGNLSPNTQEAWLGLLTLVMVVREVVCKATGAVRSEVSYFISSLKPDARKISQAIRGHWSIENGLHWVLDVVFREDARRVYDRTVAENVAFMNRLAVSLLRGDSSKGSLQLKQMMAGWDVQFLAKLLGISGK